MSRTRRNRNDVVVAVIMAVALLTGCKEASEVMGPTDPPPAGPRVISWAVKGNELAGAAGTVIEVECERNGTRELVYGTLVYTDDSSVCTAAAHAGLIGMVAGGRVTVTIQPGQANYPSTFRAGIGTGSRRGWNRGFSFEAVSPQAANWATQLANFRGQNDRVVALECPAGGSASGIWGTDTYTDDSSACTAAVHAGLITRAGGGRIFPVIRAGRSSYSGTTRNGITSTSYGTWHGSFGFL